MNTRTRNRAGFTLVDLLIVVAILAILQAFVLPSFAGDVRTPTVFRDRVTFAGSTAPEFQNGLSIAGTAMTNSADNLNGVVAGDSLTGNIAQAQITNALATAGATIGGNIKVAAITNATRTVGPSIGGNVPLAALTNALSTPGATYTNAQAGWTNIFSATGVLISHTP